MCRRPVYFQGFHKVKREWDEQAYETRCSETFSENISLFIDEAHEALREDCETISKIDDVDEAYFLTCDLVEIIVDDLREYMDYGDAAEKCKTVPELVQFYRNWVLNDIRKEVIKMEKTYRYLKSHTVDSEMIDEALYCMEEYYSDKNIDKWEWFDEPLPEVATLYPERTKATAKGKKRARACEDAWIKVSIIFIL
jgi:hypothetical protein